MIALEPRLMFDAAGFVAGADAVADASAHQQVEVALAAQASAAAPPPADSIDALSTALASAMVDGSVTQSPRDVVFIDASVADYRSLLSGVSDNALVVMLDGERDGLTQMAEFLAGRSGIESLHIVSHGGPGVLGFAGGALDLQSLSDTQSAVLAQLGRALTADGDILIYGCDFAAGARGQAAVASLAAATGADVAASDNRTGNAALGGDWTLEVRHGEVQAASAFGAETAAAFAGVLAGPTVDLRSTTDNTPSLSGSIPDPATVRVDITVNGQTFSSTTGDVLIGGMGTNWTLLDGRFAPVLPDGIYDVIAEGFSDLGGMTSLGIDGTTNELTVDTTPPTAPTVTPLTTNSSTPLLTGTFDQADSFIFRVTVDGKTYILGDPNHGNLTATSPTTWQLDLGFNTLPAVAQSLVDGTYEVLAEARDAIGSLSTDGTMDELKVDSVAPTVTVNRLITNDSTPQLTGTVNDTTATVRVSVNGQGPLLAANNGNGTWTLADNTLAALPDNTYDVMATATDTANNVGSDTTLVDLTVDTTAPVVGVNTLVTADTTPALTGTVDDPAAVVRVSVNGQGPLVATNNGNGTWTLADDTLTALADGLYPVTATATDPAGNVGTDPTTNELRITTAGPTVTVSALTTRDNTPELSGTITSISDPTAPLLEVIVNGTTFNNTSGDVVIAGNNWTLADDKIAALAEGQYDVTVRATDSLVRIGTDTTNNELIIDTTPPPLPAVTSLTTLNRTPVVSGTYDAADTNQLVVNFQGTNYGKGAFFNSPELTVAGNTWSLDLSGIPALALGPYDVGTFASDFLGNNITGTATGALNIVLTLPSPPVVGVPLPPATPATPATPAPPAALSASPEALLEVGAAGPQFEGRVRSAGIDNALFADEKLFILDEVHRVGAASTLDSVIGRQSFSFSTPQGGVISTENFALGARTLTRSTAASGDSGGDKLAVSSLLVDKMLFIQLELRLASAAANNLPVRGYSATLSDGSPLPEWLRLDRRTGQLIGEPPIAAQPVELRVTVIHGDGTISVKVFTIDPASGEIGEGASGPGVAAVAAAQPFASQLAHAAGSFDRQVQQLQQALCA